MVQHSFNTSNHSGV